MHPSSPYRSSPADFPPADVAPADASPATEVRHADAVIGLLIAEPDGRVQQPPHLFRAPYRFRALDTRFDLLDGSRFFRAQTAKAAVDRISHFTNRRVPANEP